MASLPAILDIYRIATLEKFGIEVDVLMAMDERMSDNKHWPRWRLIAPHKASFE